MTYGYVSFPGAVGSSVTTSDHASLDVTNDLEVKVLAWLSSSSQKEVLLTKGDVDNDTDASFELTHDGPPGDGSFLFRWRNSATTLAWSVSDPDLALLDAWRWYRVTVAYSVFVSGTTVQFWYSDDPPDAAPSAVIWIEHGGNFFDLTQADIQISSYGLTIGIPAEDWMVARIGYVELRDALDGAIVADPDFRDTDQITTPNTVFTDSTGKAWTINSPAIWVADESADSSAGIRKPPR